MAVASSAGRSVRSFAQRVSHRPKIAPKAFKVQAAALPAFIPEAAAEIQEPAALNLLSAMRRVPLRIASLGNRTVETALVGPADKAMLKISADEPVIVLLHGFDSSSLEFRRLYPLLSQQRPTFAVDLVGWGFSDPSLFAAEQDLVIAPTDKWQHLDAFWRTVAGGRPLVLVGASLGGAVALDFALHRPEAVSRLVLIDAQGFIDGIGSMSDMPRWLAELGVKFLQTKGLRQAANEMAYHNKAVYATEDAMLCGRLHTLQEGWLDANVAFMRSGGYKISTYISQVRAPTLVLWGRQDKILEPETAYKFESTLPDGRLEWVEECGHCPHLEQPQTTAKLILNFMDEVAILEALMGDQPETVPASTPKDE